MVYAGHDSSFLFLSRACFHRSSEYTFSSSFFVSLLNSRFPGPVVVLLGNQHQDFNRNEYLRKNPHGLGIHFFFRWLRFSLRTWTAALTWAKGEHARTEPEYAGAWSGHPEHALSQLRIAAEPTLATCVLRLQFHHLVLPVNTLTPVQYCLAYGPVISRDS